MPGRNAPSLRSLTTYLFPGHIDKVERIVAALFRCADQHVCRGEGRSKAADFSVE